MGAEHILLNGGIELLTGRSDMSACPICGIVLHCIEPWNLGIEMHVEFDMAMIQKQDILLPSSSRYIHHLCSIDTRTITGWLGIIFIF